MRSHETARVVALAERRCGVVSRQQLLRAGFDHELASREVVAGRWQVLLPGIYLCVGARATFEQLCHAALLHGGRKAVLSGAAGCRLLDSIASPDDPSQVDLLVPHWIRRVSRNGVVLRRTRYLPETVEIHREGRAPLPVATLARCVADAVHGASDLADARAFACRAARDQHLDWDLVSSLAARPGQGPGHLPQVARDLEDGVRSAPEGELNDVLFAATRRGTLPSYLLNPDLYVDGELIGSPDAYFPGLGLGDEMDSREWHEEPSMLDGTLLRHERFHGQGLALSHITPARFRRAPRAHVAKLASLVEQRLALPRPEPEGLVVLGRGPLLPARTPWPQVPPYRRGLGQFCRQAAA
jgi:hypothetical protein